MTKKRLVDLLREEAQESPDPETETTQETDQPLEPDTTLSETVSLDKTAAESPSVDADAALPAKRTGSTKADLETTVSELREALQVAYSKENSLQQQISSLQSDFQEQKILVQKLQSDLEQTNRLKAELEQAKEVILQLSKVNAKTTQEVNTPKKENKDTSPQRSGLKKLSHHSIQTNQPDIPDSSISNADIGWVD